MEPPPHDNRIGHTSTQTKERGFIFLALEKSGPRDTVRPMWPTLRREPRSERADLAVDPRLVDQLVMCHRACMAPTGNATKEVHMLAKMCDRFIIVGQRQGSSDM